MGHDLKYGKVTTQFGDIGEDEPVIVFRARDRLVPDVLAYYAARCIKAGSGIFHVSVIMENVERFRTWQRENGSAVRTPNSAAHKRRLEHAGDASHK